MNIIPIIAKADTVSKAELQRFKSKIVSELVSNGVQIYQFPTDDESIAKINATMNVSTSLTMQYGSIQTEPEPLLSILVHIIPISSRAV